MGYRWSSLLPARHDARRPILLASKASLIAAGPNRCGSERKRVVSGCKRAAVDRLLPLGHTGFGALLRCQFISLAL